MTMQQSSDALIADLVGGLEPVRPLRLGEGMALALLAAAVSAGVVIGLFGLRSDWLAGRIDPLSLVATGLFLGLGLAASAAVVMMGRPCVGSDHGGWRWAAGMAGFLPLAGVIVAFNRGPDVFSAEAMGHGIECFTVGCAASVLVFAALTLWLRRGAPTSPTRAGLVAGVAAGAFGMFAFSLHCPLRDIVHIGVWHSAVVAAMGMAGRLVVPRLVRW